MNIQPRQEQRHPKRYMQETTRSINEELYQLINNVRSLENHLVEEQKRKELLLEENGVNRQTL